jgi:hypothetical protein
MAGCLNSAQFLPTFALDHKDLVNQTKDIGRIEGVTGAGLHHSCVKNAA